MGSHLSLGKVHWQGQIEIHLHDIQWPCNSGKENNEKYENFEITKQRIENNICLSGSLALGLHVIKEFQILRNHYRILENYNTSSIMIYYLVQAA